MKLIVKSAEIFQSTFIHQSIIFLSTNHEMEHQKTPESPEKTTPKTPSKTPSKTESKTPPKKADFAGGYNKLSLQTSYKSGLILHTKCKPRGKPSDVWDRGFYALALLNGSIIPDWYICKRDDCDEILNVKLSQGNKRLRDHLRQHDKSTETEKENKDEHKEEHKEEHKDEQFFMVSYDQMLSALERSCKIGDSYGLVSFRKVLPRPDIMKTWLVKE